MFGRQLLLFQACMQLGAKGLKLAQRHSFTKLAPLVARQTCTEAWVAGWPGEAGCDCTAAARANSAWLRPPIALDKHDKPNVQAEHCRTHVALLHTCGSMWRAGFTSQACSSAPNAVPAIAISRAAWLHVPFGVAAAYSGAAAEHCSRCAHPLSWIPANQRSSSSQQLLANAFAAVG
jgi:hypothetical protein